MYTVSYIGGMLMVLLQPDTECLAAAEDAKRRLQYSISENALEAGYHHH